MHNIKFSRAVKTSVTALAVIATSVVLVFTIYFTDLGMQWITFLTGLLIASILAQVSRTSRSEWMLMRRTAQFSAIKKRFDDLSQLHKSDGKSLAETQSRLKLLSEIMPGMIALIDSKGVCQYHNIAFQIWLGLKPEQINGRKLRDVVGSKVFTEMATEVSQSLDGRAMSYERTFTMPNSAVYHLFVKHVPQFDNRGKVTGFYILANDLTSRDDVRVEATSGSVNAGVAVATTSPHVAQSAKAEQNSSINRQFQEITGQQNEGRQMFSAILHGEFRLFCQLITPLNTSSGESDHYEILIRLKEEEGNTMLPGAFFPVAEKYGLMPYLDRWVVQHVLQRIAFQAQQGSLQRGSIYFINIARVTIHDPEFPAFLAAELKEYGVDGSKLCFEVPDSENSLASATVEEFVRQIRMCGCLVALSSFGKDGVSFDSKRAFQIDFVKIDASIIFEILRDPLKLAKVTSISRVANQVGVKTIAEMVESDETIKTLREAGVDFAQGFGISRPHSFFE